MTKGTHLLRSALLALLGLVVISGASFAGGDLFDGDTYTDCPYQTRLRDGQIADLSVARDSDDEDHVNVSWTATDAAGWGLGLNAYNTSLVVILDDGDLNKQSLHLGSRKHTFEDIDTGKKVKVQMAIVVDHADGKYLISDILEMSINQSLTEPSFSSGWHKVSSVTLPKITGKAADFKVNSDAVGAGMMYYIGYNENFGNYKSNDSDLTTSPTTARLRIGLAHPADETDDQRDDVDFDAYIIRIVGEDDDVIDEGDDVATMASSYKSTSTISLNHDGNDGTAALVLGGPGALFLYDVTQDPPFNSTTLNPTQPKGTIGATGYALHNVRVVDGDKITKAAHNVGSSVIGNRANDQLEPNTQPLSMFKAASFTLDQNSVTDPQPDSDPPVDATYAAIGDTASGTVFAAAPDEHRDFPMDTMTSDETYTITAWAVNEDDEVISPVATIKVRPRDTAQGTVNEYRDYLRTSAAAITGLTTTEFTVLK